MLPHRQPCLNYRLLFLPQRHRSIFEAVCCALECFLPSFFFFFFACANAVYRIARISAAAVFFGVFYGARRPS